MKDFEKLEKKLSVKFKNAPRDTSLVPCSANFVLNREEILGVQNKLLADNNLEVNHHQQRGGQNMSVSDIVFVINQRGNPLMPCHHKKAKQLLSNGKAKVVKRKPFTIQLLIPSGETKQDITLGIDPGYRNVGFSAISSKIELISGILLLEDKMKKRLDDRRMYRTNRRNRLWYRKPRFNNRKRASGCLSSSFCRETLQEPY